jgi:hypothetical protein
MNQRMMFSGWAFFPHHRRNAQMPDRAKVIAVVATGLTVIVTLWFAMLVATGFPWF